jgi:hypothetical protein
LRLLPVPLCTLALLAALTREERWPLGPALYLLVPVAAYLAAVVLCWILLALNARWQFRRLWWVPMTLVFGPQFVSSVLPPSLKQPLVAALRAFGQQLLAVATSPLGGLLTLLLLLALPVVAFAGATALFAAGVERYRYDENALGAMLGKAPRRELGAIGRGALLAVARLRLRISLEHSRRQLLVLAVFLLLIVAGSGELRNFSRSYVTVLAGLLPASVAFQLMSARGMGHLEGLQQLPQPALTLALGHLVAVAAMAVPGAAVVLVGRVAAGSPVSLRSGISIWAQILAAAWALAVATVWFRGRYALLGGGVLLSVLGLGYLALGGSGLAGLLSGLTASLLAASAALGALLPLTLAAVVSAAGLPLFAYAIRNYQYRPK